ncbi:MAG: InlB B-repeat-containing protein [Clostridia bacterium]|nr:InlB B-repeat-containing protein [Clostridia bacterium]
MKKILFMICAAVCVTALAVTATTKFTPRAGAIATLPQKIGTVAYVDENFTATDGLTVTANGEGFAESNAFDGAFNITDITSYLEITADDDVAFATDDGMTIVFEMATTTDTYYKDNTELRPAVTDDFEQLFCVIGADGTEAYICTGGMYYCTAGGTITYAQPKGGAKQFLTTTKNRVAVTLDFEGGAINLYKNGERAQYYDETNSKVTVVNNILALFASVLKEDGATLYVRKPFSPRSNRNSSTLLLSSFTFYDEAFGAAEAAEDYRQSNLSHFNFPVTVAATDDYTVETCGEGFEYVEDEDRPEAIRITDTTSYASVRAGATSRLVKTNNGVSFSFYHNSTTDVGYSGHTELRPNVKDDFEQMFGVEREDGSLAFICEGGIYYIPAGQSQTHAFPAGGNKALYPTHWKYVTVDVNKELAYIKIYADGQVISTFDSTNAQAAVVANVIAAFSEVAYKEGGEIFIRKPYSAKINRNSATNIFGDMVIEDGGLSEKEVLAKYDKAFGKVRLTVVPNVDITLEDMLGVPGDPITAPANAPSGYGFVGYYTDENHTNKLADDAVMTESMTLYARFEIIEYAIAYHLDGGTATGENPTTYTVLTQGITFSGAEKDGYTFDGWYRTEDYKNRVTYLVEGSFGDIDLYAKFTAIEYSITYRLDGGLLAGEAIESYTVKDGKITPPAAWKPGYNFVNWYFDEEFTSAATEIDSSLQEDVVLYAKYELKQNEEPSASEDEPSASEEESAAEASGKAKKGGGCGGDLALPALSLILAAIAFTTFKSRRKDQ